MEVRGLQSHTATEVMGFSKDDWLALPVSCLGTQWCECRGGWVCGIGGCSDTHHRLLHPDTERSEAGSQHNVPEELAISSRERHTVRSAKSAPAAKSDKKTSSIFLGQNAPEGDSSLQFVPDRVTFASPVYTQQLR